jgi:hypothetical protein
MTKKKRVFTEEQKKQRSIYNKERYKENKDRMKEAQRLYREANREAIKEYQRLHREANRESINAKARERYNNDPSKQAEAGKRWRESNLEKCLEYSRFYRENNKDKRAEYNKKRNESLKDGLYTVYYLTEEHYVGQTNCLRNRMIKHRNHSKRHVQDVEVLAKFETRKEALAFEAKLHDMGYNGKNNGV